MLRDQSNPTDVLDELLDSFPIITGRQLTDEMDGDHLGTDPNSPDFIIGLDGRAFETEENFRALRAEVADVRRDVEELKSRADNSAGYSKEIDHPLARIAAIEKHLGIEKKIAA